MIKSDRIHTMAFLKKAILLRILLVSEDAEDEVVVRDTLLQDGFNLILARVDTEDEINNLLDRDTWNLVIVDNLLTKFSADRVVRLLANRLAETPYLRLFSGIGDLTAIEILEASGDNHYITKIDIAALGGAIMSEITKTHDKMRNRLELEQSIIMIMDAWGRMLELRDKGTDGHTQRVTSLTMRLARALKVPKADLINIHRGALLHDIGKIGIPDSILLKAGELNEEEWMTMRSHPSLAYLMLSPIVMLQDAVVIPYCHHEKWDGTGYPRGLVGAEIPLAARIFSICDNYDALTSDRPYRPAWKKVRTLEYIRAESNTFFDPAIVPIFLGMMESQ